MPDSGYSFYATPADTTDPVSAQWFFVRSVLAKIATATLVQVVACTNAGALSPVGFVDVHPLVNMAAADGTAQPEGTVYHLPYLRLQGGVNAVIIDPQVGDIGPAIFASRDISAVKSTKAQANPGSARMYDWADGMYLGGMLNAQPTRLIQFTDSGIFVIAPDAITLTAPNGVTINGNVTVNGSLTASGDVVGKGTSLHTHDHSGVQPGSGNSGPPT